MGRLLTLLADVRPVWKRIIRDKHCSLFWQVPNGVNHLTELSYMGRLLILLVDIKLG
jgi:hypothetical protein